VGGHRHGQGLRGRDITGEIALFGIERARRADDPRGRNVVGAALQRLSQRGRSALDTIAARARLCESMYA
jgi:hypothetical protein